MVPTVYYGPVRRGRLARLWRRIFGRRPRPLGDDWQDVGYLTDDGLAAEIFDDAGPYYGAECDVETLERIAGRVKVEILDGAGGVIQTLETDDDGVLPAFTVPTPTLTIPWPEAIDPLPPGNAIHAVSELVGRSDALPILDPDTGELLGTLTPVCDAYGRIHHMAGRHIDTSRALDATVYPWHDAARAAPPRQICAFRLTPGGNGSLQWRRTHPAHLAQEVRP